MDKINFVLLDGENLEQVEFLFKNQRDPRWSHLVCPQGPRFPPPASSLSAFQQDLLTRTGHKEHYLITLNDLFVGDISLMVDPPMLFLKEAQSGWLGIGIFDESLHGKGIAAKAMDFIEARARILGLTRLELGVFEFNLRSQKFAKKSGFVQIGQIPEFTLHQDRLWDDLRFEKRL